MPVIGNFAPAKDGGWVGTIRTLTIDVKARFVPNDNQDNEHSPAFRIFAGRSEIGAAWREHSAGENGRDYLSVRLDDPSLPEPNCGSDVRERCRAGGPSGVEQRTKLIRNSSRSRLFDALAE